MKRATVLAAALVSLLATPVWPYPLDGVDSGIARLAGYRLMQERPGAVKLPPGALLSIDDIRLHMLRHKEWDFDPADRDPALQTALEQVFASRDPSYGIAVVDFTDPARIQWAAVREHERRAPGSVGKVLCMLALFDGLRRAFPEAGERHAILRDHVVEAGDWVLGDSHAVPRFDPSSGTLKFGPIQPGERFSLAEWLDHMISASANSAATTIWKEAVLLRAFGSRYPVSPAEEAAYLRSTPRAELGGLAQAVIADPMRNAGLDPQEFKVGSMWTRVGKERIPGPGGSTATPLALARFLLRMEQGRLVDEWSSLEMKRYMYMTKRRYRYVYPPELKDAAVYFKSGSLYRCVPEEGFKCGKYMGNRENVMNSVVVVESPAVPSANQRRYLAALTSNVLRVNSAWDHSRLGAAVEQIVFERAPVAVRDAGSDEDIRESGSDR